MVGPDSSHGVSRVVHHKDFYLRGGDMTVLVENHLFRIHSYFFERESLFFRQKFNSANNGDTTEERGSTDKNAYTFEDIKSEDFARFLWVFYNPKYSVYEAPLETWLSILRLANRWSFDSVKELSVRELEKIDIEPVQKISIYHDNTISRLYLIPSYVAVCKRDKSLTFNEGMNLGMETVLRIAEARERLRQQASESGVRSPTFEDFEDVEVEVLVRDIFNLGPRPASPNAANPSNGVNGAPNGTIKLGPAPPGNHPKANGVSPPRANGGSATDPKGSSVDSLPSIASVISPQAPKTATPAPATPVTAPQATTPQEPKVQGPLGSAPTVLTSPPPPPDKDKDKDKEKTNTEAVGQEQSSPTPVVSPKSGGAGEPSSSGDTTEGAGSHDVSISKLVVPSSEHSNDLTPDPNDNVNEADKDESGKDADTASVFSDFEGGRNRQAGKNNNKRGGMKPGPGGRGAKRQ